MNWLSKHKSGADKLEGKPQMRALDAEDLMLDAEMEEALGDFKTSLHAWSDATYHRPRARSVQIRRRTWQLATGLALGCTLLAGSVSGLLFNQHRRQQLERVEADQRAAEQAKQLVDRQSRAGDSDEVLLAEVDNAVSRQVPSAMEPLAQMMEETGK